MKALGIVGSYRRGGINDTVVTKILEGAASRGAETERILLAEKRIGFCRNCRRCTQDPGDEPGACTLEDDVPELVHTCLSADLLILSSPVNFGSMTAVSQAFLERLVCLAYWPWGTAAPRLRHLSGRRMAILVTSSAAPSLLGRFGGFQSLSGLGRMAEALHAEVVARLHYGLAALHPEGALGNGQRQAAVRLGSCLVDRAHGSLGSRARLRALRGIAQSDLPRVPVLGPFFDRLASIPSRTQE